MLEEELFRGNPSAERNLSEYLSFEKEFVDPPKVKLSLITRVPPGEKDIDSRDIAVSAALQCYAPGIAPMVERPTQKHQELAETTLEAGHHTTRMHSHYTFLIEGASRSVVHDVLHFPPFYNTSQQSQRYVEAKEGNYLEPAKSTEEQRKLYLEAANFANRQYFKFLEILRPEVERRLQLMYPEKGWRTPRVAERLETKARKLSQEVARYVLPIAQKTNLEYTLNELQLLRLFRASQMQHFCKEAKYLVALMITELAKFDKGIIQDLREPLTRVDEQDFEETYIREQKEEFDNWLGGRQTRLLLFPKNIQEELANAVRNVLGTPKRYLSDSEALKRLMDPAKNPLLADVYEVGIMDPLTSCLREVSVRFATRLSHTADSQRQRQRRTPGATPSIKAMYDGKADYITPLIIRENEDLRGEYDATMEKIYRNVAKCLEVGIPKEWALLLLPNAHALRLVETGDLLDWLHRFKDRLCYRAQEEIFFISVKQTEQIIPVLPEAREMILAKCGVRQGARMRPRCPEEEGWCGQPVYNLQIEDYKKNRLI
ncbi:MAG: FAD-dependent thymidylate synthase [Patescibacteria group bacterium]